MVKNFRNFSRDAFFGIALRAGIGILKMSGRNGWCKKSRFPYVFGGKHGYRGSCPKSEKWFDFTPVQRQLYGGSLFFIPESSSTIHLTNKKGQQCSCPFRSEKTPSRLFDTSNRIRYRNQQVFPLDLAKLELEFVPLKIQ